MSISSEWNSLKATWIILLLVLIGRIYLAGQFLLTPEEALFWQNGHFSQPAPYLQSPLLSWLIKISTAIFGHNEIAVRLPALLSVTIGSFYIALIAASMFSWHTGLHVTILSQGILQFNLIALLVSPYSLIFTCWSGACYHSSQAMHSNRAGDWLFAGFWFGVGLLCNFSMALLLPCIVFCFLLIRPFRTCLLYPGPWLGFLLSLLIFGGTLFWLKNDSLLQFLKNIDAENLKNLMVPDLSYSVQFLVDQAIIQTPFVFLLIVTAWLTGSTRRHVVEADARFLALTSFPLFILFLVFPGFAHSGVTWSAPLYITAIILIAGIHSSTRSNFKGRPKRRWILSCFTAYLVTIPLVLQIAYPSIPLPITVEQTRLMHTGWDLLGRETDRSLQQMPSPDNTFVFSMEHRITGELAFYTPGNPQIISLDYLNRKGSRPDGLTKFRELNGKDGLGIVRTKAAINQLADFFREIELERELTIKPSSVSSPTDNNAQTFYVVRGFNFKQPDIR